MMNWEPLEHDNSLSRLKVPGGWLVKTSNPIPLVMIGGDVRHYGYVVESITFMPDPHREWKVFDEWH